MALAKRKPVPLVGSAKPRLAPPTPARTAVADLTAEADALGMPLIEWQETAGRYIYALGPKDPITKIERWQYPEVAVVVSRQQGKTTLLKPHVMRRLRMGRRILHAAQTRTLPRRLFKELVPIVSHEFPDAVIRLAGGQEMIEIPSNGGMYMIAAATSGGARGIDAIDDLLADEVRELDDDFMAAAGPTTLASQNPQTLYLSNAGHDRTEVLNTIRKRAEDGDPALAYLEWSASPERSVDDRQGWAEANPSLGHAAFPTLLGTLERIYASARLTGNMAHFETEHLCRWVTSMREPLVSLAAWSSEQAELETPKRSYMGIAYDPSGKRASAAIAWPRVDGTIGLRSLVEATGDPVPFDEMAADIKEQAKANGVVNTGYDPLTDAGLAKHMLRSEPIAGQKYANASARFVHVIESNKLRWSEAGAVGDDLPWTARKQHDDSRAFQAVRADDNRPITAALAAIRAVWLASDPNAIPKRRAYGSF